MTIFIVHFFFLHVITSNVIFHLCRIYSAQRSVKAEAQFIQVASPAVGRLSKCLDVPVARQQDIYVPMFQFDNKKQGIEIRCKDET